MALDYTYDRTLVVSLLRDHVKDYRFEHSLRVEQTAIELAKIHGANQAQAGLAGLLHDITKDLSKDKQEKLKLKYGVSSPVEKTLHGPTAAAWLRGNGYVTDPDVLSAIRYHTTGRPSMSLLEKIIFIADAIEPGRIYPGVDQLRHLAETNLDEAVLFALTRTVRELLERESLIDPDTISAYNDYRRMIDEVE